MTAMYFVPADGPYIHSYVNPSTIVTSPQRQRPLNRVPTAKVTSPQRYGVYKTPIFFIVKGHVDWREVTHELLEVLEISDKDVTVAEDEADAD